jgi:hypothetical protein
MTGLSANLKAGQRLLCFGLLGRGTREPHGGAAF